MKLRGFTLIELLVVIAIIGILSSVVLASLGNARVSARDAQRISDLRTFEKALELYYTSNGRYPITSCASPDVNWTSFDSVIYGGRKICNSVGAVGVNTLSQEMSPFVPQLRDPKNPGSDAGYLYISNTGNQYCILFYKTPENMLYFPAHLRAMNRCTSIDANGQCTGTNALYIGTGTYASGC